MDRLEAVEGVRLVSTTAYRRRRRLLRIVRALGVTSFVLWVSALLVDLGFHLDIGALPLVVSMLLGVGAVGSLVATAMGDARAGGERRVRIEGVRAVVAPPHAATPRFVDSTSLEGAVAGWIFDETKVAVVMPDGVRHTLDLGDVEAARGLLERLGLDGRALRVPLAARGGFRAAVQVVVFGVFLFLFAGVATAGVNDLHGGIDFVKCITMAFCIGVVTGSAVAVKRSLFRLEHGEVVVGLDGVVIRDGGTIRFIPIAEIESAEAIGSSVLLRRRPPRGTELELVTVVVAGAEEAASTADAVVEAVERAIERRGVLERGSVLDRGDKSARAWKLALSRATGADADYRTTRLDPEALGTVVLDAAAPPDRRVGAVLAIAQSSREEARARVRIASLALADEDLKASLEAAAEGEVDERHLARSMRLRGR